MTTVTRSRKPRKHFHEHPWLRHARHTYYAHREWHAAIEVRLCMTDPGMAFVYRVKKIGYPR